MQPIKRIFTFLICITIIFTSINFSGVFDSYAAGVTQETYYYKNHNNSIGRWSTTTNPEYIPVTLMSSKDSNNAFVFTAVPGATYYYKNHNNSIGRWSSTTNPEDISVKLLSSKDSNNSFIFPVVPGATYYYKIIIIV